MPSANAAAGNRLIYVYYAGTAVFMLLDYVFDFNVRLTFLDERPMLKLAWYLFCYGCLGLMIWRPQWTAIIGLAESLLTMSLIIISTALSVMIVTDEMIETGRGFVTIRELMNFVISFLIVYFGYIGQMKAVRGT